MKIRNIFSGLCAISIGFIAADAMAVTAKTSKQSVIQKNTTVRTKVAANGLYDQACYDAYYGCMDQFCITDNSNGGSCACSDLNAGYEKRLADIKTKLDNAEYTRTVEVEKVKAGANADIIFAGTRKYDEDGNILTADEIIEGSSKEKERADLMALFNTAVYDDDDDDMDGDSIASKTGAALFKAAEEVCMAQIPESCDRDVQFLRQVYSRQIVSDCKAFENSLAKQEAEADLAVASAEADVRAALRESLEESNKYDLGTCMVEFKKCMQTDDACGKDWINCVSVIAMENMQNNAVVSTADAANKYDITASTMDILSSKRNICEKVLNQCVAVRDQVWPAFLREAAPTIKVAESSAESKFRTSCLANISDCIQTACRDDIAGKGVATMDACLARPDMARSFCKVEIDPCVSMDPQIWDYVSDKLAAMRVDACTEEVKSCFTDETRCGKDFRNCIGMDYEYIHDMCPLDKLVVCKQTNANFSMDDLDSMLMGLYLNIDNAALDQCQELVDRKMAEICGSTTDCNKFASDDVIGTGSLRSQKDGTVYRVTGMISFGSIKMGDASGRTKDKGKSQTVKLGPGEIGVQEYLDNVREQNLAVPNADGIMSAIEEELNNIAGTINRTIEMIEQDPEIQFCVTGRSLSQISGQNKTTAARFPNLLNQVKMQIAIAALRQAQNNYNTKLNAEIAKATRDASVDLAQYMCQKIAQNGGVGTGEGASVNTPLTPPYAISYDVGTGVAAADLTKNGIGQTTFKSDNGSGVSKETTAIFSRDTRNCHICTTVTTQSCTVTKKGGFLGIGKKSSNSCTTETKGPDCEDIVM